MYLHGCYLEVVSYLIPGTMLDFCYILLFSNYRITLIARTDKVDESHVHLLSVNFAAGVLCLLYIIICAIAVLLELYFSFIHVCSVGCVWYC